eukprot:1667116-Rhodomonas_salina.2
MKFVVRNGAPKVHPLFSSTAHLRHREPARLHKHLYHGPDRRPLTRVRQPCLLRDRCHLWRTLTGQLRPLAPLDSAANRLGQHVGEGCRASQDLGDHHAERTHHRGFRRPRSLRKQVRRHVNSRALPSSSERQGLGHPGRLLCAREAKVGELRGVVAREEDVLGLDVAVHNILRVQVHHSIPDSHQHAVACCRITWQRPAQQTLQFRICIQDQRVLALRDAVLSPQRLEHGLCLACRERERHIGALFKVAGGHTEVQHISKHTSSVTPLITPYPSH